MNCNVENCTKPLHSKKLGLCAAHYQKYLRYGTATPTPDMKKKPGPAPDPTKARSRHNPDNPSRSRPKKEKVERTHCKNGHELNEDNRYWHKTSHSWVCKTCAKNATRKYRLERDTRDKSVCKNGHPITPENTIRYGNYDRCLPCVRAWSAKQRLRKYGITQEEYDTLIEHQGGVCAICKRPMNGSRTEVIDHDHVTGQVRGILHGQCNTGLGMFEDNPEFLINAAKYLMDSWRLSTDSPQPQPQD